jgi:hypothetical protein
MIRAVRPIAAALGLAGALASPLGLAVRVNPAGTGQALIYPYYTTNRNAAGNDFVTALALTNTTPRAKAVKLRVLEAKAGAPVLDLNIFLAAYDVWTAGIVRAGAGAGIFTADHSCTSPAVASSASTAIRFRNGAYASSFADGLGDSLDRTNEGYVEVLEMGVIDPGSALAAAVTPATDFSAPGASKPACTNLPDAIAPNGLSPPSGGLSGNASYINVDEGTDFSVDAIALSQWSDVVQWGSQGSDHPNLADASPPVSIVADASSDSDRMYITRWASGRDAVSALFMVETVFADYTVEAAIRAAADVVMTQPTKRFHVTPTRIDAPYAGGPAAGAVPRWYCEYTYTEVCDGPGVAHFDREGQQYGTQICGVALGESLPICGAAGTLTFTANLGSVTAGNVLGGHAVTNVPLNPLWMNGYVAVNAKPVNAPGLAAPPQSTTIVNLVDGSQQTGLTVTYAGLPIVGFSVQDYSTTGLPGVSPTILSNYGGNFVQKARRRITVAP